MVVIDESFVVDYVGVGVFDMCVGGIDVVVVEIGDGGEDFECGVGWIYVVDCVICLCFVFSYFGCGVEGEVRSEIIEVVIGCVDEDEDFVGFYVDGDGCVGLGYFFFVVVFDGFFCS